MKTIDYSNYPIKNFPSLPRSEPFFQDSTAYKTLVDCRWKYFLRFVLGRVPTEGNPNQIVLDFGSAYHKFRELLETKGYLEAMGFALQFNLPRVDSKSKWGYLDQQRLVKTCHAAHEHWLNEKKLGKIEVVAVEQPFNALLDPETELYIAGRADQIVKWNGRLWGRDFKTTSKDKAQFSRSIDPDDQAIRYIWGESKIHGQEIQGILFEAVYNVKTVGPQIYTLTTTRSPIQIKRWEEEQKLNSRQLKVYRENDIWPMDTGRKCVWCEYHKVCTLAGNPTSQENLLKTKYSFQPWDHTKVEQEVSAE